MRNHGVEEVLHWMQFGNTLVEMAGNVMARIRDMRARGIDLSGLRPEHIISQDALDKFEDTDSKIRDYIKNGPK